MLHVVMCTLYTIHVHAIVMRRNRAVYSVDNLLAKCDNMYFSYHANSSRGARSVLTMYTFYVVYCMNRLHAGMAGRHIETGSTNTVRGSRPHYSADLMTAHHAFINIAFGP